MSEYQYYEFLEVDPDLLAGAGMGTPAVPEAEISPQDMDAWIDALPRDEVHSILKHVLEGKGQYSERSIKHRFAAWRRGLQPDGIGAPRRSLGGSRIRIME